MIDLIQRSDAIKAIWGKDINPSDDGLVFEAQSHIDRDIRLIPSADRKDAPSIDIVRCKECTYWTSDSMMMICGQTLMPKEDDDYCSWGEREGRR